MVGYHSDLKKGSSDIGYNVMSLENIILSEISQRKKDKYIIHLYEVPSIGRFIKAERRLEVTRDWKGSRESLLNGYRGSVWGDEKVLEIDGGDDRITA